MFRNKIDEHGTIVKNKAKLVSQDYNQEEGIDFDETYAYVARLEAIALLIAYACNKRFKLYQMDIKNMLILWSSKKQNSVITSTIKAKYVSVGSCCAQILWLKQQLEHYGIELVEI